MNLLVSTPIPLRKFNCFIISCLSNNFWWALFICTPAGSGSGDHARLAALSPVAKDPGPYSRFCRSCSALAIIFSCWTRRIHWSCVMIYWSFLSWSWDCFIFSSSLVLRWASWGGKYFWLSFSYIYLRVWAIFCWASVVPWGFPASVLSFKHLMIRSMRVRLSGRLNWFSILKSSSVIPWQ